MSPRLVIGLIFIVSWCTTYAQEVIITEIMYQPLSGESEWVEIYNKGNGTIDLTGWQLGDIEQPTKITFPFHLFQPQTYLCIADMDFPSHRFGSIPLLRFDYGFPRLNNSGDTVYLRDQTGSLVDSVQYLSSWGGDKGTSLERINLHCASQEPGNWSGSVHPQGGTPGKVNSIRGNPSSEGLQVRISPNPFQANREMCRISYQLPWLLGNLRAEIYDMAGIRKRTLVNFSPVGSEGEITWNGQSDAGNLCPLGMYILYVEVKDRSARYELHAKRTIVLVR